MRVTALQVFETNIPQFLQVNSSSARRRWAAWVACCGRRPSRSPRTCRDAGRATTWTSRSSRRNIPGALFQLKLALAPEDAHLGLPGRRRGRRTGRSGAQRTRRTATPTSPVELGLLRGILRRRRASNWNQREDPCNASYYRYAQGIRAARNLLASNIGLIAKRGAKGKLLIVATALDSSQPQAGVKIDAVSYQNQVLASAAPTRMDSWSWSRAASPSR